MKKLNNKIHMMIRENDITIKCNPTIITIIRKKTDPPYENQRGNFMNDN